MIDDDRENEQDPSLCIATDAKICSLKRSARSCFHSSFASSNDSRDTTFPNFELQCLNIVTENPWPQDGNLNFSCEGPLRNLARRPIRS